MPGWGRSKGNGYCRRGTGVGGEGGDTEEWWIGRSVRREKEGEPKETLFPNTVNCVTFD